jgi:hypothetical protein
LADFVSCQKRKDEKKVGVIQRFFAPGLIPANGRSPNFRPFRPRTLLLSFAPNPEAGLPDFSWLKHTKMGKVYQMTTSYIKRP